MRTFALLALSLAATAFAWFFLPPKPQLRALEDVLGKRSDNDPRLDSAFNDLTGRTKEAFRAKYKSLPREALNDRGTIVYLLGKNLAEAADWQFLMDVAAEPPGLSLADCSKPAPSASGDDVTLAYPALVALKAAENVLKEEPATRGHGHRPQRQALQVRRRRQPRRQPSALRA